MKPILRTALILLVASWLSSGTAATLCPPTDTADDWPAACFVTGQSGERHVRPQYVKNIRLDRRRVALIIIAPEREMVAVDAVGKVVIPGIRYTGDFDYPDPPEGLGRYDALASDRKDGGKRQCGYFNVRTFKIVIPAVYDYCARFDEGTAKVCTDCFEYCLMPECQNSIALEGQAMLIDTKGKRVRQVFQPTLANVCHARGMVKVGKTSSSRPLLECVPVGSSR